MAQNLPSKKIYKKSLASSLSEGGGFISEAKKSQMTKGRCICKGEYAPYAPPPVDPPLHAMLTTGRVGHV